MSKTIVFAGPCLAGITESEKARLLESMDLRPPVQRGDILHALADQPETIVVLDGYFYTVRSVTHKELLLALQSGVQVIGAASMGALRAVELRCEGMIGVGKVFRMYETGSIDGDDEVAILHTDEHFGYQCLTLALVEIRFALKLLLHQGHLTAEACKDFIQSVKDLPFTERYWKFKIERLAEHFLGDTGKDSLFSQLDSFSLKQEDARNALELARALPEQSPAIEQKYKMSLYTSHHRELYLREPTQSTRRPTFLHSWHVVQLLHPQAAAFVHSLRIRFLLMSAAKKLDLAIDVEERRRLASQLTHLPFSSYEATQEVNQHLLAIGAINHFHGVKNALSFISKHMGLEPSRLIDLFNAQDDLMPTWFMARAFLCTSALSTALKVAREAAEVQSAFDTWSNGRRIRMDEMISLAARLWNTSQSEVERQAALRGLFPSRPFASGLRPALELIAPAELLPSSINNYDHLRAQLLEASLSHILDLSFTTQKEHKRQHSGGTTAW